MVIFTPKRARNRLHKVGLRERRSFCRSAPHSWTSNASYGLVGGTCSQKTSNEIVETGLFHRWVPVHFFCPASQRRVYRRRWQRFADARVLELDRYGGSVMVWGGISNGVKSPMIVLAGKLTAVGYRDEVLRHVVVPFVQLRHVIFQKDIARPHVARVFQDLLATINPLNPLKWPPFSPDLTQLNIVGRTWEDGTAAPESPCPTPTPTPPLFSTNQQLPFWKLKEWNNIPIRRINALMNPMHNGINAVTEARGGHTRYWRLTRFQLPILRGTVQCASITEGLWVNNYWFFGNYPIKDSSLYPYKNIIDNI